ncbi:MAG: hypothetical protein IM574_03275 [Cytophagales bacterium]|jgi:hypothetical protein|nr:hypothetical protein [Cytophagales bacterium]MCA6393252.1 hypothetical protein [Cytophagales bacterium]MCA6396916.1 hypothetical protein [Cytophagales bacterium]MCA6403948.1 hypothetical protein [Cytophagales bacterium]MCA6412931.1 hypothetical protein [Cytophagales bacterium]
MEQPVNVNLRSRVKQLLVLAALILAGIVISQSVNAKGFHKSKAKHFKSKYKSQIKKINSKVCFILAKKRTQGSKQPFFAFLQGKAKPAKYKPQAEVDPPSYVRINYKPFLVAQSDNQQSGLV